MSNNTPALSGSAYADDPVGLPPKENPAVLFVTVPVGTARKEFPDNAFHIAPLYRYIYLSVLLSITDPALGLLMFSICNVVITGSFSPCSTASI